MELVLGGRRFKLAPRPLVVTPVPAGAETQQQARAALEAGADVIELHPDEAGVVSESGSAPDPWPVASSAAGGLQAADCPVIVADLRVEGPVSCGAEARGDAAEAPTVTVVNGPWLGTEGGATADRVRAAVDQGEVVLTTVDAPHGSRDEPALTAAAAALAMAAGARLLRTRYPRTVRRTITAWDRLVAARAGDPKSASS